MPKRLSFFAAFALVACAPAQPRSTEYFHAHLDEARQVAEDCRKGSASGEECANASLANKVDDDRKRFERFRRK
ncbi:MAG: EexN family lipoprotein [Sphingopyxis sp.]|uniref:EexN family lipoprotein n=1 Tax=Sphingopyxis sp. TaxID=1908224 RepID=UPI003D810C83